MRVRAELIPLGLALALVAAVGGLAVQARQDRADREAAAHLARISLAAEAQSPADPAGGRAAAAFPPSAEQMAAIGTVHPGDLGALPLRIAALPAPTRDVAEIQRILRSRSRGTYIADMLVAEDSLLVRWPDRTVTALRVWVQPRADVPNWNSAYPQMVRDVFPEWSAAGFPLRFLHVVDSASADLHVRFTTSLGGRQIGTTRRYRDRHGWVVAADILLATESADGVRFSPAFITGIARHEVGHALGLGHARDSATVMFPESVTTTIAAADRATLHLLYTLPPGPVR